MNVCIQDERIFWTSVLCIQRWCLTLYTSVWWNISNERNGHPFNLLLLLVNQEWSNWLLSSPYFFPSDWCNECRRCNWSTLSKLVWWCHWWIISNPWRWNNTKWWNNHGKWWLWSDEWLRLLGTGECSVEGRRSGSESERWTYVWAAITTTTDELFRSRNDEPFPFVSRRIETNHTRSSWSTNVWWSFSTLWTIIESRPHRKYKWWCHG